MISEASPNLSRLHMVLHRDAEFPIHSGLHSGVCLQWKLNWPQVLLSPRPRTSPECWQVASQSGRVSAHPYLLHSDSSDSLSLAYYNRFLAFNQRNMRLGFGACCPLTGEAVCGPAVVGPRDIFLSLGHHKSLEAQSWVPSS